MNGKFILDTNIVIALFAKDADVMFHLSNAEEVFVPSIVIGELFYGAYKSSRVQNNLKRINEFVANNTVRRWRCSTD